MNYNMKTCETCERSLPRTKQYFKRVGNGSKWGNMCIECLDELAEAKKQAIPGQTVVRLGKERSKNE